MISFTSTPMFAVFIFKDLFIIYFGSQSYTHREREMDLPPAGSLLRWPKQPRLDQAQAANQDPGASSGTPT